MRDRENSGGSGEEGRSSSWCVNAVNRKSEDGMEWNPMNQGNKNE